VGKQLATALKAAGGIVDTAASIEELIRAAGERGEETATIELSAPAPTGALTAAALLAIHLDGALADAGPALLAAIRSGPPVIAVLPRANLAMTVDLMLASDRVAGVLVAEDLDTRELSAMATRVLAGDLFGLDKLTPWGTQIHSFLVGDYQEKSLCISHVSQFAEHMGVRRKHREAIEQCLDEMLMNALYDAPVDDQGRQIFAEIPTKTRISLRVEQKVVVQYACDGRRFGVAVRDAFGTLERGTVLRYLHKCLHQEQQIDRKAGGAGLGLYLMTNSAAAVYFNVLPGVATEAVCTFNLDVPKQQLSSFGVFLERIDAAGRLASGPVRRLPAGATHPVERRAPAAPRAAPPRGLVSLLVAAILITMGLAAVVAWPRVFGARRASVVVATSPPGASIEVEGKSAGTSASGSLVVRGLEVGRAYPIVARLEGHEPAQAIVQPRDARESAITLELVPLAATVLIESTPSGATVEHEGKPLGTTPLAVTTLPPGREVTLAIKRAGYADATARITVPRPGKETRLIQPLALSRELARVRLVSDPPGAQVLQNGQLIPAVTTPTEILVEADRPVRFMLTMPRKIPLQIEPFTPTRGADDLVRGGKLVDGTTLRVTANTDGALGIAGVWHCQGVPLPATCVLAPGTYTLDVAVPAGPRIARLVKLGTRDVDVKIEVGFVDAGPGRVVVLPSGGVRRAAFPVGPRRVVISDGRTARTVPVQVRAGATALVP
jgi:hypothetical protein